MAELHYNWKRFWCLRDGYFRSTNLGFLEDPDGPYGHIINPEARTLTALSEIPCLVLLGETGIGKSQELAIQGNALGESAHLSDGTVLRFELRDFDNSLK